MSVTSVSRRIQQVFSPAPSSREKVPASTRTKLERTAAACAYGTLVLCGVMTVAWIATGGTLQGPAHFLFEMKLNTAVGFGLLAAALLLMIRQKPRAAVATASAGALIGLAVLAEYLELLPFSIDNLIVADRSGLSASYPGRTSPNTATVILALGAVMPVCIHWFESRWRRFAVKFVCFAAIAIAMQALIGHLMEASFALGWGADAVMALPTTLSVGLVGVGLMAHSWALEEAPFARMPMWIPALLAFPVLFFDMNTTIDINAGIAYIPLVFCALWFTRPHVSFVMAAVSTLLIALGYLGAAAGDGSATLPLVDRGLSVMGVWTVALLVFMVRRTQLSLEASRDEIKDQHQTLEFYSHALLHDLREPVRTINAFAKLSEVDPALPLETRQNLSFLRDGAERMGRLIDAVAEYSGLVKQREPRRALCDMSLVLEDVCANLATLIERRGAQIKVGRMPFIEADEVQMGQLLQNLISNAILHCEEGVRIEATARLEGNAWLFAVSDNGPGIPAEARERVFEPFRRLANTPGTSGLGLAIARRIVESHGGNIRVEAECLFGTTISFTLAAAKRRIPKMAVVEREALAAIQPRVTERADGLARVLIVDDTPSDLELAARMLRGTDGLQCHLFSAQGVESGLALLRAQQASGAPIDLVLLDIYMPGRDGYEMLDEMKADPQLRDIPVVMCSGSQVEIDHKGALTHGAAGFVLKPPSRDRFEPILGSVPSLWIEDKGNGVIELLAANDAAARSAVPQGVTRH